MLWSHSPVAQSQNVLGLHAAVGASGVQLELAVSPTTGRRAAETLWPCFYSARRAIAVTLDEKTGSGACC
jgi:hypothetical protein